MKHALGLSEKIKRHCWDTKLMLTDQFPEFLHIHSQNSHHETEDTVHVLGEFLLDVSTSLCWQRLKEDYILGQPQQNQHHQFCLCFLWKVHDRK